MRKTVNYSNKLKISSVHTPNSSITSSKLKNNFSKVLHHFKIKKIELLQGNIRKYKKKIKDWRIILEIILTLKVRKIHQFCRLTQPLKLQPSKIHFTKKRLYSERYIF